MELLSELLVCWPMLMLLVQERGLLGQVLQVWEPRQELLALLVLLAWWAAALVLAWHNTWKATCCNTSVHGSRAMAATDQQ